MPASPIRLNIVTALECEARPVAARLGLEKVTSRAHRPLYLGDGVALTVSGIGRRAAEVAVKFLHLSEEVQVVARGRDRLAAQPDAAWLNIGIGGARDLDVGQGVLAHRVEDAGWSRAWYPRFVFEPPCPTATVRTIDYVERAYFDPVVYEMEAAGFATAATKISTAELVHVYKIISDGPTAPTHEISKARVEELVSARIEEIAGLAGILQELAVELASMKADPEGWEEMRRRWHFTQTQLHQLRRLMVRGQALRPGEPFDPPELKRARTPRQALAVMDKKLRELAEAREEGSGRR